MLVRKIGAARSEHEMNHLGMLAHVTKEPGISMTVGLANLGGQTLVEPAAKEHHQRIGKGEVTDRLMAAHQSGGMTAALRSGRAGQSGGMTATMMTARRLAERATTSEKVSLGKIGTGDSLGMRDGPKGGRLGVVEAVASSERSADLEKMTLPWPTPTRGGEPTRICRRSMVLVMDMDDLEMGLSVMRMLIGQWWNQSGDRLGSMPTEINTQTIATENAGLEMWCHKVHRNMILISL